MVRNLRVMASGTAAAFCLLAAACSDGVDELESPGTTRSVATDGALLLLNSGVREAVWLRPESGNLQESRVELPGFVADELMLSDGRMALLTQQDAAVMLLNPDGSISRQVDLVAPFSAIAADETGRWLVAYFAPGRATSSTDIFLNVNQIQVIDLQQADQPNRVLTLVGSQPSRIDFVPAFTLGATPLSLLVASGEGTLVFVNPLTDDVDDQQRLVRLTPPDALAEPLPSAVRCEQTAETPMLCTAVISNFNEVFVVELLEGDSETGWTFQPTINLVNVGDAVFNAYNFDVDGERRLLVTTTGNRLHVVDPSVRLDTPVILDRALRQAFLFIGDEDGVPAPRAVLFTPGSDVVYFAELDRLELEAEGALSARRMSYPIESVVELPGATDLALIRYQGGQGVGILRLSRRSEVSLPVQAGLQLQTIQTFAGRVIASVVGLDRLALLDAGTGVTGEVQLQRVPLGIEVLSASSTLVVQFAEDYFAFYNMAALGDGPWAHINLPFYDGFLDRGEQ